MRDMKRFGAIYLALGITFAFATAGARAESANAVLTMANAAPARAGAQQTSGSAGTSNGSAVSQPLPKWIRQLNTRPFSHVAVTGKVSPLGIGVDLATPMGRHFNLRVGGNYLRYTDTLTQSGVQYQARLSFTSGQVNVDWYPWGRSFHVSAGALVYNNSSAAGNGEVPGGTSFTVNGTNYVSSQTDPVHGNASITLAKSAPMFTIGWGNPLPRNGRRFSFPFEMGFVYVGDPAVKLNFAGSVCDQTGQYCEQANQYPGFQSNLAATKAKLQTNANYARFYPVISIGYSFRF